MQTEPYPEIDPAFGHWLAGFIDGEGCFCISRRNYAASRHQGFNLLFTISLRGDDAAVLAEIHERLGVGHRHTRPALGASKPAAEYRVVDKAGLLRIVDVFDRFPLRAKKAADFALWREAVFHYATIRKGPWVADWGPVPDLFARLRAQRVYAAPAS